MSDLDPVVQSDFVGPLTFLCPQSKGLGGAVSDCGFNLHFPNYFRC